ncbi:hypothetical protein AHAS_Ahas09G0068100 [Arachis hypogaea]
MQTMKIPREVCSQIDKACRDFFWRSNENEKKIHLINWDIVCKPKYRGRPGIQKAQDSNNLFLMKLAWNLVTKTNFLWVKVMKSKYECSGDAFPKVHQKPNFSNAWKGIVKVWNQFKINIIWRCPGQDETLLHVLRDCPYIRNVWVRSVDSTLRRDFFNQGLHNWME